MDKTKNNLGVCACVGEGGGYGFQKFYPLFPTHPTLTGNPIFLPPSLLFQGDGAGKNHGFLSFSIIPTTPLYHDDKNN